MAGYQQVQDRQAFGNATDIFLPDQVVNEVLQSAPVSSTILARARQIRMSSRSMKQPVLASLPDAYWVNGEPHTPAVSDSTQGLKQTTRITWDKVTMTAEELAVIVPIPDALIDDANIPLWASVRPLLVEALGKKIDEAILFGVDKPAAWPAALVPGAIAAGNTVAAGTGDDLGVDVAQLGEIMAKKGLAINGFISRPGLQWSLIGLRNNGNPIYTPPLSTDLSKAPASGFYGYPLNEVTTGVWDDTAAEMVTADWSRVVVGIRQDITFSMFSEGVISDDTGKIVINLMQQDTKALRVVMRVGYSVAMPANRLEADRSKLFPAGVITPDLTP
jgi:HK97 family phage major capsid protein